MLPEIGICSNWIHGFRTISPDDNGTPSNKVTIQKTYRGYSLELLIGPNGDDPENYIYIDGNEFDNFVFH